MGETIGVLAVLGDEGWADQELFQVTGIECTDIAPKCQNTAHVYPTIRAQAPFVSVPNVSYNEGKSSEF